MNKVVALPVIAILCAPSAGWATPFSSEEQKIEFETPASWIAEEDMEYFSRIFVYPTVRNEDADRTEIVIMTVTAFPPQDLSGVRAFAEDIKKSVHLNYTDMSEEDVTANGRPAKQLTYNEADPEKGAMRRREIYTFGPTGVLYHIGFDSTPAAFDGYWNEAKVVVDTLKFN